MLTQIINGRILTPQGWLKDGSVLICDGKILEVTNSDLAVIGATVIDARGMTIVPGFVSMHAHGGGGHDFTEATEEAFRMATTAHLKHGATSMFPTLSSTSFEKLYQAVDVCEGLMQEPDSPILGLHIEGPYLNPKMAGSQYEGFLKTPDENEYIPLLEHTTCIKRWDISPELRGQEMERATDRSVPFEENPAAVYAAVRNLLYAGGKKIEILGSYEPKLQYINEWWKQLYGESEGKQGKGIFPASVTLTADLHSMGQYIQEGERTLFETIISVEKPAREVRIEADAENLDGLNFLAGKRVSEVNRMAELGVQLAHMDGGVPNIRIAIPEISARVIGGLLYFFEKACGISGYLLGVNPFNQPGVEAYKKNMFALLDKPGYEEASKAIKARL